MINERMAYLALTQVPGMGPARLKTLLTAFSTANGAHSAPFEFLCTLPGFSRALASAIKSTPLGTGRLIQEAADRLGAKILIPDDPDYPELLRHIPDPPPVLFALGDTGLLTRPAAAIVGSREHSSYGAEVCRRVAAPAAEAGIVIVSGMARGLDAVAHAAALDSGGTTIGVLGNGPGVIYPAANRKLYERVATGGLLLSEFPPGERPNAGSFPRRNRLISGLSRVTVVIEAAEGSGALITAGTALDQGREVLAVPGNITSVTSVGCNRLIRDGATPLLEPADLLQHFPEMAYKVPEPGLSITGPAPLPATLSAAERQVALLLSTEPVHPDELAERCGRPIGEVLSILCGLEIAGITEQRAGRLFLRRP
ncbi:MAG TPA: DNA-processing protein DprA [Gemmatimonadales bacterium]|nr:DNA-processing protein DprA [Gemmatimonadales bacterium]